MISLYSKDSESGFKIQIANNDSVYQTDRYFTEKELYGIYRCLEGMLKVFGKLPIDE